MIARTSCRVCSGPLDDVLSLGEHYVSNFPRPGEDHGTRAPLELALCRSCRLLQLRHTVSGELMYRNYWYRSGTNSTMRGALAEIAHTAEHLVPLAAGDSVLDIGCNDGTLLAAYRTPGIVTIGFDPAENMAPHSRRVASKVVTSFFALDAFRREAELRNCRPKIVTSIAMFYDLEDPGRFVSDVKAVMDPEGLWIVQMSYLPLMLKQRAFDNVCLPPGGLVVTARGLRPIEKVSEGDLVLTGRGRFRRVLRKFQRDYEGELVEVQGWGLGHRMRLTPNHPVLIAAPRPGDPERYVPAEALRVGDVIGRPVWTEDQDLEVIDTPPRGTHRPGSTIRTLGVNETLMEVCGLYLAEGFTYHKRFDKVFFSFGKHEGPLVKHCVDLLRGLGFSARVRPTATSLVVESCGAIARFLGHWFGRGAARKRVPMWALRLPAKKLAALLGGYAAGDAYVYRGGRYVRANTVSEQLAFDLTVVGNKLGHRVSISRQHKEPRYLFDRPTPSAQRPLWDVLICLEPEKQMKTYLRNGMQLSRVRRLARVEYEGPVFNLEVEDDGTYVTPGGTVHNCHEHLEYYSMESFESLLQRHDFEIVDIELNDVNGGSMRAYIRNRSATAAAFGDATYRSLAAERTRKLREQEAALRLDTAKPYAEFAHWVERIKGDVVAFIKDQAGRGRTVYVYGASTKGNTLLQYFGLDRSLIRGAAERNPDKWGRETVGTRIPIVSEEEARNARPDYFLVLPWHFMEEFQAREEAYLLGGGRFIVPLPRFSLI